MENNSEHDTGLTSGSSAMPEPISLDDVASKLATVSTIFNPKTRKMSPW